MKLLRCLAVMCFLPATCHAQLPEYYKTINRVTWLSRNIDAILPTWIALGMTDVRKYDNLTATGADHGKRATILTRQATGRLGNLTVSFLQSAEGESNSYNDFLKKHDDGIFSVVHEVPTREAMDKEIRRMASLGVGVLQIRSWPGLLARRGAQATGPENRLAHRSCGSRRGCGQGLLAEVGLPWL